MFFIFSIVELVLLGSGVSMLLHHRIPVGAGLIVIAVLLVLITSASYTRRSHRGDACGGCGALDCLAFECGFLEGLECAECGGFGCDCFGV